MVSKTVLLAFNDWLLTNDVAEPENPRWDFLREMVAATCNRSENDPVDQRFSKQELLGGLYNSDAIARFSRRDVDNWLDERKARYHSYLRERGETCSISLIDNGERGGRGRQKLFWFEDQPLTLDPLDHEEHAAIDLTRVQWRQVPASEIKLNFSGRLLFGPDRSFRDASWRSWIYKSRRIWRIATPVLFAILFVITSLLIGGPIKGWHLSWLVLIGIVLWASYDGIFRELRYRRQTGAYLNFDFVKLSEPDTLIEHRWHNSGTIYQLARYEADCPLCSSKLRIADGEPEWPGRIIGRCIASPSEHIYSLDRVSLLGQTLRPIQPR
ncbi:MAG: hypothetical protein CL949_13780 [Erythrobacter sp.]|nr:hypothetical protein [Erythrobacter sp.]